MSYTTPECYFAAQRVAQSKGIIFYFADIVTDEQSFKDNVRFFPEEAADWVVPDWNEEQPIQWNEVELYIPIVIEEEGKTVCKEEARKLLAESDWSVTPDAQASLLTSSEWLEYRQQIRQLFVNPVANPTFPVKPEVRWGI